MFSKVHLRLLELIALCGMAIACSRNADSVPATESATQATTSAATGQIAIAFNSDPSPPQVGDNTVEVAVKQADGVPLDDAEVTVVFYMPAMPSMNMPEMRNTFTLKPAGAGLYRGEGQLVMSGTWDVTVNVMRNDEKLASDRFTVIAK